VTGSCGVSMAGTIGTLSKSCLVVIESSGMIIGVLVGTFGSGTKNRVARGIGSWESAYFGARRSHRSYSMMAGWFSIVGVTVALFVRSILIFVFVDRRFALCAFMWPFSVAWERGGCFRICFVVSSGKVVRKPVSIAWHRVCRTGDHSDAW